MAVQRLLRSMYCPGCLATQTFEQQADVSWKCPACGRVKVERER